MMLAKVDYECHKGWFKDVFNEKLKISKIAILRLDGDWYDSTILSLNFFYSKVSINGVIIINDYFAWEGCAKVVHDFLCQIQSKSHINTFKNIAYIVKKD